MSTANDDACYTDVGKRIGSTRLQVLARDWMRLDGAGDHRVQVELATNDVVVPAGHQLGLVIAAPETASSLSTGSAAPTRWT